MTEKNAAWAQELDYALKHYQAGDTLYRHSPSRLVYTEGVRYMAEEASAYWLIDAIMSWQTNPRAQAEEFQLWVLTVASNRTAELLMDDGNGNVILRQKIAYTDFPLAEVRLYFENQVLLLPSER